MRLMEQDDRALIQRWQREGDGDAFAELVRRHGRMVFATADRVLRNPADAEEVVQESFVKVGQVRRLRGDSAGGLLHTIATHLAINRLKSESRRREREIAYATVAQSAPDDDWVAIASHVDEAIASLPDAQREAVVRHFLEAQSYRAIADAKGLDESTVRHHAQRGLGRIRRFLQRRGITAGVSALTAGFAVEAQASMLPAALVSALGKQAVAGPVLSGGLHATAVLGFGGAAIMTKKVALGFAVAAFMAAGVVGWRATVQDESVASDHARNEVESTAVASVDSSSANVDSDTAAAMSNANNSADTTTTTDALSERLDTDGAAAFAALLAKVFTPTDVLADGEPDGDDWANSIHSADIPEDNGMHFLLEAWERLMKSETFDEDVWKEFYRRLAEGEAITDEEWANYAKMNEALDLLRHGMAIGNIEMPIGTEGPETLMPFLVAWRGMARILKLDAEYNVARGDYAAALDDYQTIIQLGNELGRGGPVISGLVGIAVGNIGTSSLIDFMTSNDLTSGEYRAVLASLQEVQANSMPGWESQANEQTLLVDWFEANSSSGDMVRTLFDAYKDDTSEPAQLIVDALDGVSDSELLRYFNQYREDYDRLLQYSTLPYYEAIPLMENVDGFRPNLLAEAIMPTMPRIISAFTQRDARLQGVITVAAIEAYRVERGAYPYSLYALVPEYISNPATDPFTGAPLHYQPRSGGYRLYSSGADMMDNGGTRDDYNEPGSDLVFSE